jgi:type 1 glutamine amidotransferase
MKKLFIGIIISLILYGCRHKTPDRVLVFTKTTRYHHESIPAGIKAIQQMGLQNNFEVDTTTDSHKFSAENLSKYSVIIFLSTSGELLDPSQQLSLQNYIRSGGGFVGIHSASASEKKWPWFGKLIGAVFTDHPEPQIGNVTVLDKADASVANIPSPWVRKDEWYNFETIPTNVHLLLGVDEKSYKGGKNGPIHPLAWKHEFEGGRVFYTALGHFSEAYQDKLFLNHILEGIKYAMGEKN